jgi:hypothetical protein
MAERRAADERLASLRVLCDEERESCAGFSAAMDAWVEGLGSGARVIQGDIDEVTWRMHAPVPG